MTKVPPTMWRTLSDIGVSEDTGEGREGDLAEADCRLSYPLFCPCEACAAVMFCCFQLSCRWEVLERQCASIAVRQVHLIHQ